MKSPQQRQPATTNEHLFWELRSKDKSILAKTLRSGKLLDVSCAGDPTLKQLIGYPLDTLVRRLGPDFELIELHFTDRATNKDPQKCVLCGGPNDDPYGHNPEPIVSYSEGRCCTQCNNERVIPVRLAMILGKEPRHES